MTTFLMIASVSLVTYLITKHAIYNHLSQIFDIASKSNTQVKINGEIYKVKKYNKIYWQKK